MYIMKIRLLCVIAALVLAVCCLSCSKETPGPSYIVQVSLGGWNRAEFTAEQVIARLDTVSRTIPVGKVIMGWSKDREIYRQVGDFLHGRGIELFLWLPVFAETEEVCENTPAVDLWGQVPDCYNLTEGDRFLSVTGYPAFGMDVAFLESQLEAMESCACAKFPGIEINYREGVAPTSPAYVRESLDAVLRHGFDGAVLSWNIMEAPEAHVGCLGER